MSNDYRTIIRTMSATEPRSVEGLNNKAYLYYFDKLLKMIYSVFKFDNIPEYWDMSYFKEKLFINGVVCLSDTTAGIIPLICSYSGINVYGKPTDFQINNPVLGNITGRIDIDGVMIYCMMRNSNYIGMVNLIDRYATLLAEADGSLQTTLINSRMAHVFSATSEGQLKTMQKMYDKITKGQPAVFIRKNPDESNDHVVFNDVKRTFIGQELIDVRRSILNEFMSEIGINNANTQKRERLITSEVDSNKAELNANIYEWFENLNNCFAKANKLFNLNIQVSFNTDVLEAWQKDGGVE